MTVTLSHNKAHLPDRHGAIVHPTVGSLAAAAKLGWRIALWPPGVEQRKQYETEWEAIKSIAAKLGIGCAETLRKWVRQAEVDGGKRPGVSSAESAELRRLRLENKELASLISRRPVTSLS